MNVNTIRILINIDKKDIVYLNSIIDSYEGLAIMRTIDRKMVMLLFIRQKKWKYCNKSFKCNKARRCIIKHYYRKKKWVVGHMDLNIQRKKVFYSRVQWKSDKREQTILSLYSIWYK